MGHGITLLQRDHDGVGIVNSLFHRLSDRVARVTVSVGNPFQEGHHLNLVPLHLIATGVALYLTCVRIAEGSLTDFTE
ncbi:LOW QUALITY PROTEIN: Cysteine protease [Phytophthora megakarya]|nr:LOW QUALITY PROTEIN: Cysteine protease [Phytophthora megakarya]